MEKELVNGCASVVEAAKIAQKKNPAPTQREILEAYTDPSFAVKKYHAPAIEHKFAVRGDKTSLYMKNPKK